MRKKQFLTAEEAVAHIPVGSTVVLEGGSGGFAEAESVFVAVEKKFLETGSPRDLTIIHSNGMGNAKDKSIAHFAHEGLVKRVIGGHYGMTPAMGKLAEEGVFEAYNFPQGVISQLYREIAGRRPGLITKTGLQTFVDPRLEGGKLNEKTTEDIVQHIELSGEEWLFYPSMKIDVVILRGTTVDEVGNLSMEEEAAYLNALAAAQAAKASGGIVIAQAKRLANTDQLDSRLIKVPGIFIDYVVIDEDQQMTYDHVYHPAINGSIKTPINQYEKFELNERKVVARRAAMEIKLGSIVNLGYGMSAGVSSIAAEEGISKGITFAVEQGAIGGVPFTGVLFGASLNPHAILDAPSQFDFFDSGMLDIAFLGMAQCDAEGNVNVSKFGKTIAGCGGFINITQNAKRVVYCSSFTAGGLRINVQHGKLVIENEGKYKKFNTAIDQVTFSAKYSLKIEQEVLFITERAVFRLNKDGLLLEEIAPGIDLHKDVIDLMEFKPEVSPQLKEMDKRIFLPEEMNLAQTFWQEITDY